MIFLAFSQDDTRVCFNVSIIDDNIHEQDKVFFAKINTSDSQVILSPHFTNITIESDDGMHYKQFLEKFYCIFCCEPTLTI